MGYLDRGFFSFFPMVGPLGWSHRLRLGATPDDALADLGMSMDARLPKKRLSRIKTRWTTLARAHQGQGSEATAAQHRLLLSYYRAVYLYLRAITSDPDIAEELTNEFSVRFLRGDFAGADPKRGRFRDLVKAVARHLALDYWKRESRRKKRESQAEPPGVKGFRRDEQENDNSAQFGCAADSGFGYTPECDAIFLREWRRGLLAHAWKDLARTQRQTNSLHYSVLRYKAAHPHVRSARLAEKMTARLGRPFTADSVRQILHRARDRFADTLVDAVACSLQSCTNDQVEAELAELGYLGYCKEAMARRRLRK